MNKRQSPIPLAADLDPKLLTAPFRIETNWHVITGAPCSGKTTLINLLVGKGFQTVPEIGRKYIEAEIAQGRSLAEIRANHADFARIVMGLQLQAERGLKPGEVIFLDRGLADCLTYFRQVGLDPNEVLPDCFEHRYASVFLLDRFPVQKDGARTEDDCTADLIDEWLNSDYSSLGYQVERVPVLPPDERLAFILERLALS